MIEEEYALKFQTLGQQIADTAIKQSVLAGGETTKGASGLRAEYHAGRITWDTKGLDGFAKANSAILTFRKQGEPYIVIKKP